MTRYQDPRTYLPAVWQKVGVTADQTAGVAMTIPSISKVDLPFARKGSVVSVGITLTDAVTAGFIRFELTKDGTPTGKTFDMDSASGLHSIWEFPPGDLVGLKGEEIGILWGSNAALLPTGTIEAVLYVEVQWA